MRQSHHGVLGHVTLLDKTKKEVTEKEPFGLMSLSIRGARSDIPTWWFLWSRGTHLMRCSRAVTLLEVGPRSETARSPRRMWRTPSSSHRGPWDFIRHQNSQGDVENGFCDGVAGLKDKEDKRSCSRSCPSWPRTPPNPMKVEQAGRQVASVVLRNA